MKACIIAKSNVGSTGQDINIAEQMVMKGFAKWVEPVVVPHQPFTPLFNSPENLLAMNPAVGYVPLPNGHFSAFIMASPELFYIMVGFVYIGCLLSLIPFLLSSLPPANELLQS